jgi:uncharacterized membrane protein YphA (DoxX/SURF4 family)
VNAFDAWLGRRVRMRALAQLRIPAGLIAAWQLRPVTADALAGRTYQDSFHRPYLTWLPDLPEPLFAAVLVSGLAAALLMAAGLLTRVTAAVTFGVFVYYLLLSATHVHHNRSYLAIVLGVLAIAPSGREWSLHSAIRRRRGLAELPREAPAWPLWLLRIECCVVYGASGLSKLLDPDWIGGTVTWGRVVLQEAKVRASVLPGWLVDVLVDRDAHRLFAPGIVATELFIAFGLWPRRTRPWALAVAVLFHVMIELTSRVETFSYLAVAVLLIWQPPDQSRPESARIALPRRTSSR